MASIRITQFGGLIPDLAKRIKPDTHASIAHNCVLEDGTLRPQAKWVRQGFYSAGLTPTVKSIAYDPVTDRVAMYTSHDVVLSPGEPFAKRMAYGASLTPPISQHNASQGLTSTTVAVYNYGITGTVLVTPANLSTKPVNRVYAVSRVRYVGGRREEGGLAALIGDPDTVMYEGDYALINVNFTLLDDGATHVRIYRSISGLDTGDNIQNELDTEWHLIAELPAQNSPIVTYIDGGAVTTDPLDVHFAQQFHPPTLVARFFGLTASGWWVAVSQAGEVQISERYMAHAWPSENTLNIQETVTDMAVHGDNVYLGTKSAPYVISVAQGEKGVQAAAVRFDEVYPCRPGSMTPSASGVIYASTSGLVALSREGMRVITGELVNPGDKLYTRKVAAEDSPNEEAQTFYASIGDTNQAIYYKGKYYGFCGGLRSDMFYLTSALYPYYYAEGINASGSVDGILDPQLWRYSIPIESVDVSGSIVDGSLRQVLKSYEMEPEAIDVSGEVVAGSLDDILVTYDNYPPEGIDITGAIASISLADILITYDNYTPEGIDVTGAIVGASLT